MATAFQEAQQFIPGGVNSPVRAFKAVGGEPVFIHKAKDAYLWDIEGKRYVDYVLSWGPMILGHANEDVIKAVVDKVQYGLSFGAPTEIETSLASLICNIMPGMDKVRFVNSGTEATMSAIRLARGFTGRDTIVKFEGCYHGHSDALLVKAGSGALTFGVPSSPGVPESFAQHTITLTYNDIEGVRDFFAKEGDRVACIIVEPVAGNMNCIPPVAGFLEGLREVCSQYGSVLIFDEVMTGFRISLRGAQGHYNVQPDITCLGKVIGGGMPVGAFGGREDIMNTISPVGPVYQAGTLSGNPVAMAAGIATVSKLTADGFYDHPIAMTDKLCDGMEALAKEHGIPFTTNHAGTMWGLFFTEDEKVTRYHQVIHSHVERFNKFFHMMLNEGVYLAPASYEAGFMSAKHSREDIDYTLQAAKNSFSKL